jgi:hypothetical protein
MSAKLDGLGAMLQYCLVKIRDAMNRRLYNN